MMDDFIPSSHAELITPTK